MLGINSICKEWIRPPESVWKDAVVLFIQQYSHTQLLTAVTVFYNALYS